MSVVESAKVREILLTKASIAELLVDAALVAGIVCIVRYENDVFNVLVYEMDGTVAHGNVRSSVVKTKNFVVTLLVDKRECVDAEKVLPMRPTSVVTTLGHSSR